MKARNRHNSGILQNELIKLSVMHVLLERRRLSNLASTCVSIITCAALFPPSDYFNNLIVILAVEDPQDGQEEVEYIQV